MSALANVLQQPHRVARVGARWDVLSSVLPVEGQGLLAAGHNAGFVQALFPVDQPDAEAMLIDLLGSVTGLRGAAPVEGFLRSVEDAWEAWEMSRARNFDVFRVRSTVTVEAYRLQRLREAVTGSGRRDGRWGNRRSNENYRCLSDTVEFLGAWIMLGDEGFSEEQLGLLDKLAGVWLTVVMSAGKRVGL